MYTINRSNARFENKNVERDFSVDISEIQGKRDAIHLFVAGLILVLYSIVDAKSLDQWYLISPLRVLLFLGTSLFVVRAMRTNDFTTIPSVAVAGMSAACLIILFAIHIDGDPDNNYQRGIVHVVIICSIVLRVEFIKWAACLVLITLAMWVIGSNLYDEYHFAILMAFHSTVCAICCYGVYLREISARNAYIMRRMLQSSNDELSAKSELLASAVTQRKAMISILGHITNTPLHQTKGFAELIAAKDPKDKEIKDYTDVIINASADLAGAVKRLLNYNSLPDSLDEHSFTNIGVSGLLSNSIRRARVDLPTTELILENDFEVLTNVPLLIEAIDEIIDNLMDNEATTKIECAARLTDYSYIIEISSVGSILDPGSFEDATVPLHEITEYKSLSNSLPMGLRKASKIAALLHGSLHQIPKEDGTCLQFVLPLNRIGLEGIRC